MGKTTAVCAPVTLIRSGNQYSASHRSLCRENFTPIRARGEAIHFLGFIYDQEPQQEPNRTPCYLFLMLSFSPYKRCYARADHMQPSWYLNNAILHGSIICSVNNADMEGLGLRQCFSMRVSVRHGSYAITRAIPWSHQTSSELVAIRGDGSASGKYNTRST